MERKPHYANWVTSRLILLGTAVTLALLLAARAAASRSRPAEGVLFLLAIAAFALTFYMLRARTALSYEGGGVQGKVIDSVLNQLTAAGFDGHGRLLDIGCGSGAMSVRAAKRYPRALITGLDFWGKGWDYSQAQCEENARLEGVAGRIAFRQGDAAKLPFVDGAFDAAVSNFVFHEVRTQPDKHALFLEALRVLKPGGVFAFQDVYYAKSHYGRIEDFVDALRPYVSEIHMVDTRKPDYAPPF